MTITVRLDPKTDEALRLAAKQQGLSKSELVRQCLQKYLDQNGVHRSAWELGKDLFGKYGSDRTDLARNAKRIAGEKIRAKNRRR